MGASKYPESGLSAVLDLTNWSSAVQKYLRDVDQMNKADSGSEKASGKANTAQERYNRTLKFASDVAQASVARFKAAGNEIERTGQSAERSSGGISRFTERLLQIDSGIRILNTVTSAVERISDGVTDLAGRAMRIEGIGRAFGNVTAPIGNSQQILADWREQAQGAVSDLDLMRLGNIALINTTRESREVIGQSFGTVVRAAFAGAAATGQDFNYILEKMILGLRRQSNMRLDDIGVWVEADEANHRYAEGLGITVSQMTDAQKAAAWQAEAIRQMNNILDQTGAVGITSIQRASAEWQNAMDRMAVATEEGVARMDYGIGQVMGGFADLANRAAPYAGVFTSALGDAFAAAGDGASGLLARLDPEAFFEGGANIIAALAHGILSGLTLVVQAANVIASAIADFLMGFSPPPLGPLSLIDVGGANVVDAWLSGFSRVSTGSVEALAGEVNGILGSVGDLDARDQVTVLEQLQKRLQGRLEKSVAALMRGTGSAAEVRNLDAQRAALAGQIELLQERAALEQVGLKQQSEALSLSSRISAVEHGDGGESSERAARTEKDRLAELRQRLAVNAQLQAQYQAMGMDVTDLQREELNLNRQVVEELTTRGMGLEETGAELRRISELESQLERPSAGGGGAGAGVLGLDEEGVGPLPGAASARGAAGMSLVPPEIQAQFAGRGPAGLRARLGVVFSGIETDYNNFVVELDQLSATLSTINPFEAVQNFVDGLREDPGGTLTNVASGIGEIVASIPEGFSTIIGGIATEIERITGIHVSEGFQQAASLIGGIALAGAIAGPILTALAAGFTALLIPVLTIAAPIAAIGLLLDLINQRFGGFPQALEEAGNTLKTFGNIVAIGWDDFRAWIEDAWNDFRVGWLTRIQELDNTLESIGIDIIPDVDVELDEARARQQGYELRDDLQYQVATAIQNSESLHLTPDVQMALQSGAMSVPERTRMLVTSEIEQGLAEADEDRVRRAVGVAIELGMTFGDDLAGQIEAAIGAELYNPVNVAVAANANIQVTERGYEYNGQVYGSFEAFLQAQEIDNPVNLRIQNGSATIVVTERGYEVNGEVYGSMESAVQASMPPEGVNVTVPLNVTYGPPSVGEMYGPFDEAHPAYTQEDAEAALAASGTDRSRGFGAGGSFGALPMGSGALMSGREAAAGNITSLIDVLRNRYVSEVTQPFQEQYTSWTDQVRLDSESVQTSFVTMFDTTLTGLADLEAELLLAQTDITLVDAATLKLAASVAQWYAEAGTAKSTLSDLALFLREPYYQAVEQAKIITEGLADALERIVDAQAASGYGPAQGIPYGGGRAHGGSVDPDHVYRVGEREPEWFVPDVAGQIIPQSYLSPPPIIVQPAPVIVETGTSSTTNWNVNTQQFDGASVRRYHEMTARGL